MGFGKIGVDYPVTFGVRTGSGGARTGLVGGDFATLVSDPDNSATDATSAVTEVGGGQYRFSILAAFTTANGVGVYGPSVRVTTPPIDMIALDSVPFFVNDLDDLNTILVNLQSRLPAALVGGRMDSDVQRWLSVLPNALVSGRLPVNLERWLTATPNALVAGRVDVTVGAMQAAVLNAAAFAANAITNTVVADGFISEPKVAAATLTAAKFAAAAITSTVIADNAITNAKIADNAITAAKIATAAITSAKFAAGAIDAAAIATDAITAAKIATDAIGADQFAASAVAKIEAAFAVIHGAGSWLTASGFSTHSAADVDAILTAAHGAGAWTTATGFAVAGDAMTLTAAERDAVANALLDLAGSIEDGVNGTVRRILRLVASVIVGLTATGPNDPRFRAVGGTKVRVDGTADPDGIRTAVTLDSSDGSS